MFFFNHGIYDLALIQSFFGLFEIVRTFFNTTYASAPFLKCQIYYAYIIKYMEYRNIEKTRVNFEERFFILIFVQSIKR